MYLRSLRSPRRRLCRLLLVRRVGLALLSVISVLRREIKRKQRVSLGDDVLLYQSAQMNGQLEGISTSSM